MLEEGGEEEESKQSVMKRTNHGDPSSLQLRCVITSLSTIPDVGGLVTTIKEKHCPSHQQALEYGTCGGPHQERARTTILAHSGLL